MGPTRKQHRLPAAAYGGDNIVVSVTAVVRDRRRVFADPVIAAAAVDVLRERASFHGIRMYAFCVMPDHVHLVFHSSETCDPSTFVGQFKNLAQRRAWAAGVVGVIWQRRFWDRVIRDDDALDRAIQYVLNNPVRAGFVSHPSQYPFLGPLPERAQTKHAA